jgi:pyruvate/2-oxoglutarate dehydrogenase complex dihydrolipoamide acyltransferase (E2) component
VDSVRAIPIVVNGALAIRSVATVGLTYDTRLCDESDAVPFLTTLRAWLEGGFIAEVRR